MGEGDAGLGDGEEGDHWVREGTWVEKQVVGGVTQSCRVCVYWGRAALTLGRNKLRQVRT